MKTVSILTAQRNLSRLTKEMTRSNSGIVLTENKKRVALLLPVSDVDIFDELEDLIWAARAEKILSAKPKLHSYADIRADLLKSDEVALPNSNHRTRKATVKKTATKRRSKA